VAVRVEQLGNAITVGVQPVVNHRGSLRDMGTQSHAYSVGYPNRADAWSGQETRISLVDARSCRTAPVGVQLPRFTLDNQPPTCRSAIRRSFSPPPPSTSDIFDPFEGHPDGSFKIKDSRSCR
jgi:hypothetical protein